ncbi:MAG: hypothetical protein WCR34_06020, partial [Bacilli bacterium]
VIASDFEDEVNFSIPQTTPTLPRGENGNAILMSNNNDDEDEAKENKDGKADDINLDDDILPSFLKD